MDLRDLLLHLAGMSAVSGRSRVTVRKLFVSVRAISLRCYQAYAEKANQITALALKLVPGHPSRWTEWILECTVALSGRGAPREYIFDFLVIAAEEIQRSDLLPQSKSVPACLQRFACSERPPGSRWSNHYSTAFPLSSVLSESL